MATPLAPAVAVEVVRSLERDFTVRSGGQIRITNFRGSITVKAWSQDRIRVRGQRAATAPTAAAAEALIERVDVRFQKVGSDYELSADFGKGLDIAGRVQERRDPFTRMNLEVSVPASSPVHIWGYGHPIEVKGLGGNVEVRASSGDVRIQDVSAKNISVTCPACAMQLEHVRGSVRCMGGEGSIELTDVGGPRIYIETASGFIRALRLTGDVLFVSKTGSIFAEDVSGKIEFNSQQGSVELSELNGFLSGRTDSGNIIARINSWQFLEKAFVESNLGSVRLTLPPSFVGDVDFWSMAGKLTIDFPVQRPEDVRGFVGPVSSRRLQGRVGQGGELLRVFSDKGAVEILRGSI